MNGSTNGSVVNWRRGGERERETERERGEGGREGENKRGGGGVRKYSTLHVDIILL